MTTYVASGPPPSVTLGGTWNYTDTFQLSVTAVTYAVQIVKIERICVGRYFNSSTGPLAIPYSLSTYVGATVSGGAGTVTPSPLRLGAAPATATSRYGTASDAYVTGTGAHTWTSSPITFTGGTRSVLRSEDAPSGVFTSPTVGPAAPSASLDYQFPSDLIMPPGNTFLVSGLAVNGTSSTSYNGYLAFSTVNIYFNELHLARSN